MGGKAVLERKEEWGGGGTWDGVRTEACGWFDLSHVCVQPRLFTASWMSMKRWLLLPPSVLAQVGAYCPVLLSFLMMLNFLRLLLSTPEVSISQISCMFSLHICASFQA